MMNRMQKESMVMDTNYTQFQIDTPTQQSFGMQYQSPNQSFDMNYNMNYHISPQAMNNGNIQNI